MIDRRTVERIMRLATWACVVALAILSLLPKEEMIRTGADSRFEHFIAYAATMAVSASGYARRIGLGRLALMLTAYAGVLELGQHLAPGRSPALFDFAAGAVGIAAATLIHVAVTRR